MNWDYRIEAMGTLLDKDCILQGFYPLIPHRENIVRGLKMLGCDRKSAAENLTDDALIRAGLPEEMTGLFRQFLALYDPRPAKMREISTVSETREEEEAFRELYMLPGVKSTRAKLYMRAGFAALESIAAVSAEELMAACQRTIEKENLGTKAPLLKEARTHIAVAVAFTDRLKGIK